MEIKEASTQSTSTIRSIDSSLMLCRMCGYTARSARIVEKHKVSRQPPAPAQFCVRAPPKKPAFPNADPEHPKALEARKVDQRAQARDCAVRDGKDTSPTATGGVRCVMLSHYVVIYCVTLAWRMHTSSSNSSFNQEIIIYVSISGALTLQCVIIMLVPKCRK